MKIAFRCDASVEIGSGHVVRCLVLAEALRSQGAEVCFICRDHPGNLVALIQGKGIDVLVLPRGRPVNGSHATTPRSRYARWLGASQHEDAEFAIDFLTGWKPDWIVVDHYGLDRIWEGLLRSTAARMLVLDDLADRPHDCDILVDAGRMQNARATYAQYLPEHAVLLTGLNYCLLHPRYAKHRMALQRNFESVRRVLLYFGASDPTEQTGRWLGAIRTIPHRQWDLDLVIGRSDPRSNEHRETARTMERVTIHENLPDLAALICDADLGVGAAGGTSFERCCLGLPSISVITADNQRPAANFLAGRRAHFLLGGEQLAPEAISRVLQTLPTRRGLLCRMSRRAASLVDGGGVSRIADAMRR